MLLGPAPQRAASANEAVPATSWILTWSLHVRASKMSFRTSNWLQESWKKVEEREKSPWILTCPTHFLWVNPASHRRSCCLFFRRWFGTSGVAFQHPSCRDLPQKATNKRYLFVARREAQKVLDSTHKLKSFLCEPFLDPSNTGVKHRKENTDTKFLLFCRIETFIRPVLVKSLRYLSSSNFGNLDFIHLADRRSFRKHLFKDCPILPHLSQRFLQMPDFIECSGKVNFRVLKSSANLQNKL